MNAYKGPPIESLLNSTFDIATAVDPPASGSGPAGWMFHSIKEAWEWCANLSADDTKYLVNMMVTLREFPEDKTLNCDQMKTEQLELFYRSVSYTILMLGLFHRFSFSNDYKVLKCIAQVPENGIKIKKQD
jgi:hypothetical protein